MLMFIRQPERLADKRRKVSIHPMLMFIGKIRGFCVRLDVVSIHPMLMFIYNAVSVTIPQYRFNTSYVNVYQLSCPNTIMGYKVSIHPMLMFIQRISAISKNNYTNFSSIYQLFSIFYQPITHFIVFK